MSSYLLRGEALALKLQALVYEDTYAATLLAVVFLVYEDTLYTLLAVVFLVYEDTLYTLQCCSISGLRHPSSSHCLLVYAKSLEKLSANEPVCVYVCDMCARNPAWCVCVCVYVYVCVCVCVCV